MGYTTAQAKQFINQIAPLMQIEAVMLNLQLLQKQNFQEVPIMMGLFMLLGQSLQ